MKSARWLSFQLLVACVFALAIAFIFIAFYGNRDFLLTGIVFALAFITVLLITRMFLNVWNDYRLINFKKLSLNEQYVIANTFLDNKADHLKKNYPEITGYLVRKKHVGGHPLDFIAITIQVKEKTKTQSPFPLLVFWGKYSIPIDVQQAGFTTPHISLDSGISRNRDLMSGTLGIPITRNGTLHYLSCYHVYCNQELANGQTVVGANGPFSATLISPCFRDLNGEQERVVGRVIEGQLTDYLDVAVMLPETPISNIFNSRPGPFFYQTLTRDDEHKTYLQFWGNGSKRRREGLVINIATNQYINYKGKSQHYLKGLIQIERCAVGGDSGAAACDLDGNFIGCVIGSDDSYTYILSAYNITDKSNYTL